MDHHEGNRYLCESQLNEEGRLNFEGVVLGFTFKILENQEVLRDYGFGFESTNTIVLGKTA